jgi:Uma2 family endonuclease
MSVAVSLPPPASPLPTLLLRRFTVDEYHHMIRTGILAEDEPVELLDGWIVFKMPRNPPHDATIHLASEVLAAALPLGWGLRIQSAITTGESEPEPDLSVVRGRARDYLDHHPAPGEIGMLVEIADSSLEHDRTAKGRAYARAAIPLYWIVNLPDRQVEVYSDPTGPTPEPTYRTRRDYVQGDMVPLVLDGREVARIRVGDLLP